MALSNILREPRREITEQLVGLLVVGAVLAVLTLASLWATPKFMEKGKVPGFEHYLCIGLLLLLGGILLGICLLGVTHLVHAIGEDVCNALAKRGLELRPKQRY